MKNALSNLSTRLKSLHKDLLQTQCRNAQDADERRYDPFDLLQLSAHDPRFRWLKKISTLVIKIDHLTHGPEEIEILDAQRIFDETTRLLSDEDPEFSSHYKLALKLDPHLYMKRDEIRSALRDLQPFIRDMHEMHAENEKNKFKNNEEQIKQ